jgi:uncharacterized protein YvpB
MIPVTQIKTKRIEAYFVLVIALFVVPLISIGGYFVIINLINQQNSVKDVQAAESEINTEQVVLNNIAPIQTPTKVVTNSKRVTAPEITTIVGNREKILPVPQIKQIYKLSCEAASIEMSLKYFGIDSNQDSLISQIGFSLPIKSTIDANGNMIWGDPDAGFVGDVDGYMIGANRGIKGATGWGTKKGPVERVVQKYLPNSKAEVGSIEKLKRELDGNNPIIFWHIRDDANTDSTIYYTPEGKKVDLYQYHVAVIKGYKQIDGVLEFMINDPLTGEYTISQGDLNRIWQKHGYDMVVVRK